MSASIQPLLLDRVEEVEALVDELFSPDRVDPVVVVTTRNGEAEPLIDAASLAIELEPVLVRVLPTGPLTWELTGLLPEGLGVFGGAARIWWPGFSRSDPQHRHPLIFAYSKDEGSRAARRIVEEVDRRSWQPAPIAAPAIHRAASEHPPEGSVITASVRWAAPGGAELELAPDLAAWLVRRRRDPELAVGDYVEVRIVAYDNGEPVLERLRPAGSPTAPATAVPADQPAAARPGPHLFRRHIEAQVSAHLPEPPNHVSDSRIAALEVALAEALEERSAAERRAEAAESEAGRAIRQISRSERELKRELRSARDRMAWLEEQLRGTGRYDDPEQQLRHEIDVEWERSVQGSDRQTMQLRPYVIGSDFLPSLSRLEGVPRSKVVEVCVDVLTGRAESLPSRELVASQIRCKSAGVGSLWWAG